MYRTRANYRTLFRAWWALVVCLLGFAASSRSAAEPADLFELIPSAPIARELGPEVLNTVSASVHMNLLRTIKPGNVINLNVSPGASFVGVVERVEPRGLDRFTVMGSLEGEELSSFLLVVGVDSMAGIVRAPTVPRLYHFTQQGDGLALIYELDPRLYPFDSPPMTMYEGPLAKPPLGLTHDFGVPPGITDIDAQRGGCGNTPPIFDILIVWTAAARQAAGGTSQIREVAVAAIEEANRAYGNSQITARMRLVHTAEVTYDENGAADEHLARLINPVDGIMDDVHTLRLGYRADFVNLFVDTFPDPDTAGIGFCSCGFATAFSVARWDQAGPNFTLAHETGHNMGCVHNREDAGPSCPPLQPYAYGWRWFGDSGTGWRSVMAYNDAGSNYTRIAHFSNPNVNVDGQPTGVPIGNPDQAHNAAAINLTPWFYEAFYVTRYDIWVDFSAEPDGNGTFELPYDNVAEGADATIYGSGASDLPTLWIKSGTTSETPIIGDPMRIRSCGGTVTIGSQG